MYTILFIYLAVFCALGTSRTPHVSEKRQFIPFPESLPFQNLSGDQAKALSAIEDNNLRDFCSQLLGQTEAVEDAAVNILPRQNINVNSNFDQEGPGGSSSYSYSSSNNSEDGQSETDVDYNLNGVTVPSQLAGYQPNTIQGACIQFLGGDAHSSENTLATTPSSVPLHTQTSILNPAQIPAPAVPVILHPGISYQNVFYGRGTFSPSLKPAEKPGLEPAAYVPGEFHTYRLACATACSNTPAAVAFMVSTDFKMNRCSFVAGESIDVGGGDIVPISDPRSGKYHLEAWNKHLVD